MDRRRADGGRAVDPKAAALRELVAEKLVPVEEGDYFGLLGVTRTSDNEAIREAYQALALRLHPDRVAEAKLGRLAGHAQRVYEALGEAYAVLTDPARRSVYLRRTSPQLTAITQPQHVSGARTRERPPSRESVPAAKRKRTPILRGAEVEAAEVLHQRGNAALLRGGQADGEELLRRAYEMCPERALYALRYGWAVFRGEARPLPERLRLARDPLEAAAALEPYNVDARYCLAQYWKAAGNLVRYRQELQAVLRCPERHQRARKELDELDERIRNMREETARAAPRRGFLGKLIARKTDIREP